MNPHRLTPDEIFPAAIRLIHSLLIPGASLQRQRVLAKMARLLAKVHRQLAIRPPLHPPAVYVGLMPPKDHQDLRVWGQQLRRRREECGLSRVQLSRLTGVSDSTIRNVETARHKPSRSVVMRLQAVPALGMPAPPGIGQQPIDLQALAGYAEFACNCWFAPEFDSIKIARELVQRYNGTGGRIDQAFLFTDHASAAAWCAVTAQPVYRRTQLMLPMAELAQETAAQLGPLPLDIIGLGAGEAKLEVRLLQALHGSPQRDLRLFLLDLSQPLLSAGYKHAASVLAEAAGVGVFAIQGDFHNLPSYTPLFDPVPRRRLVCMFGDTFCTLENEILFVRNSLGSLAAGDLFLIDVPPAVAPAERPAEIRRKDPQLAEPRPKGERALQGRLHEFLGGPFLRYVRGVISVSLRYGLDLEACAVPGSYAVDFRAHVQTQQGPERIFSVGGMSKRYDPSKLTECMGRLGWELVKMWRYADPRHRRLLFLYRKAARVP